MKQKIIEKDIFKISKKIAIMKKDLHETELDYLMHLQGVIEILNKYDNLESIIQNIDNIKGKVSENLSKSKDSIAIAKKLIELKKDVDIDLDPEKYIISKRDELTLSDLASKYQLKSLSDSFGIKKVKKKTNLKKSYKVIDNESDFEKLLLKLVKKKIFSCLTLKV